MKVKVSLSVTNKCSNMCSAHCAPMPQDVIMNFQMRKYRQNHLSAIASQPGQPGHLGHSVLDGLHILNNCKYFVQFCTFYTIYSELRIECTIFPILRSLHFLESYAYFAQVNYAYFRQLCTFRRLLQILHNFTNLHMLNNFCKFSQFQLSTI